MQLSLKYSPLPGARQAGVCLHLTSLPGEYGIGSIGKNAMQFIDALTTMNLAIWQFLPTGPTAYGNSPYQLQSTFAGNEMLIDIEELIQLNLLKSDDADPLRQFVPDRIDYGKIIPLKNALLAHAADRFESHAEKSLRADFEQFLHEHDQHWLHNYALYRVIKRQQDHRPWPAWDQDFALRQQSSLTRFENKAQVQISAVKVLQFLFQRQWQRLHTYATEKGIRLFGDMPIYIALDSADAWSSPEILLMERGGRLKHVAGVPPDYFSKDGQLWGNPLYDWQYQSANGFQWWIARLRHAIAQVDLVRIDHFRGFEAYWSVPAQARTARKGLWNPGPGEHLFELAGEALGRLPIVAEDLGEITPAVEKLRDRFGIPGMKVLQFELLRKSFDISNIDENCVCYTGTHDNDTTAGWFRSGPDGRRGKKAIAKSQEKVLDLSGGKPESIHHDLIRLACSSKAGIAIAPMQDFLGLESEARINTPGTTGNNWCWRLKDTQMTPEFIASVGEMIALSGRSTFD